ncbi:YhgE/Pip domain-containing protein [Gordonia sp. DT219]|uniref:YhgE/Pip domain-containing protein n=1 Tax=Gordonia sp. DT219 TaxID=3416658 RepID=UPI003CF61307
MGRHEEPGTERNGDELADSGAHEQPESDAAITATISEVLGSPRFWLLPLLLVLVVMSLMATLYMGAISDPEKDLHNFPIALVDEDSGGTLDNGNGTSTHVDYGRQVADGIVANAGKNGIAIHRTDRVTALNELNSAKVYGVVSLGANFSASVLALGKATVLQARPEPVTVTVYINRGSGTFASAITTTFADRVSDQVNQQMGKELTDTVQAQLAKANVPFSGAAQLALWQPVKVDVVEAVPLPDGSGNGLSAFYFTLLLILAGFTGAMMVSIVVDGILGQTPIEFGPFYQLRVRLAISRWGTLAAKWTIMGLVAMVQSALFVGVCTAVGTSLPNAFTLWAFSVLVIFAVGVSASSMMAVFGNVGLILNLVFFVILGLPSSGGTVPLEASPRLFTWVAAVEPMHLVYLGVRAILYFDADWDAGLGRSIIQTIIGLAIGALLGWAGTVFYDRKGWHRYPGGMRLPPRLAAALDRTGTPTITTPSPHHSPVAGSSARSTDDS